MKIEKITLCNLTSIEGEHTIDFTREPLRSANLFAITGDTGSGKSTLLDAVCLALYNHAPRFDNVERITSAQLKEKEGDNLLQTGDVRQILRRGEKEAYCLVTFSTPDRAVYEAEWRLRIKRTGTYDSVSRSLQQIKPEKKKFPEKEIDEHIVRIIGLDYLQFTRTVMLAQNSFSNFLKAKRGEKSALLEKLTGTEIYGQISQQIYQLSEKAKEDYNAIENELKGINANRLEPEDLQLAEEQQKKMEAAVNTLTHQQQIIEQQLRWYAENTLCEQEVRRCEEAFNTAHKTYVALRNQELQLERYDDVLCIQPLYQELAVRRNDITLLKRQEEGIAQQLETERKQAEEAQLVLKGLLERTAEAEMQFKQRRPAINRGHALNGEIKEAQEQLLKTKEEYTNAQRSLEQRRSQHQTKLKSLEIKQKEIEELQLHQQALAVHKLMFERIDLIKDKLNLFNTESRQNAENHKKMEQLQKTQKELAANREHVEKQQQLNLEKLSTLKSELSIHIQTNQGHDSEDLQQRFADYRSRLISLERAAALWQRISNGYEEICEKKASLSRILTDKDQLNKEIVRVQRQVEILDETFRRLNVAFTLSQSENIVQLRQQLKEGSACPVCGATHHPYHTETERELGELLSNLEQENNEAKELLTAQNALLNSLREQLAEKDGRLVAETTNLQERERQQAADVEEWHTCEHLDHTFHDCSESVNRNARRLMIEMLSDNTRKAVDEAEKELKTFNYHQQHINRLNQEINALSAKISEGQTYLEHLRTQYQIAVTSIEDLQHTLLLSDRSCQQFYNDLDDIITLSGWFASWNSNPDGFRLRLTNLYADWLNTCKQLDENQRNAELLVEEIRAAEANQTEALRLANRYHDNVELATQTLSNKRQEFVQLFGHDGSPEKEEDRLQQLIQQAREKETAARNQTELAAERLSQTRGTQQNLLENRLKKQEEYSQKTSELDLWILKFNGTHSPTQLTELDAIFADPRDWNALRRHIDEVKKTQTLTQHNLEAARNRLLELQSAPVRPNKNEGETVEVLKENYEEVQLRIKGIQKELAEVNMKIMAHQRSLAMTEAYEARRSQIMDNRNQWSSLCALLGSADGKKFRELAQSYTFEYLIEHANHHLRQLSPRYELQTVAGTLALEIIDHDMFDQHRYVHSLSGGETFVVSLSLALGLASLSSNNLAIGSLFIDEGFGNLDEESLQLVMSALSRLETTQGRKVGVISHTQQIRTQIYPQIQLVKLPGSGKSKIEIR